MTESGGSGVTGIATIAVSVTDQERALEFYVGTLGFEIRRDMPFGSARWLEVGPPGSGTTIALVPAGSGIPLGIRLTTGDADADHSRLLTSGVDADADVTRMGSAAPPMFSVRDPDGNTLVLVEGR